MLLNETSQMYIHRQNALISKLSSHSQFIEYIIYEIDMALLDTEKGLRTSISSVRHLLDAQKAALQDFMESSLIQAAEKLREAESPRLEGPHKRSA